MEDQFVNIIKSSHKSSQPNMNSTIKVTAKVAEKLNQSNENSDTKKAGFQHIKQKLGESLKKNRENKIMHGQYIRSMDRHIFSE